MLQRLGPNKGLGLRLGPNIRVLGSGFLLVSRYRSLTDCLLTGWWTACGAYIFIRLSVDCMIRRGSSGAHPVCDVRCAPAGKRGLARFTMVYGRYRGMPRVPAEPISKPLLDIYGLHGSN